jgi:hypothetical protein
LDLLKTLRVFVPQRIEDIPHELAVVRSLFNDLERRSALLPFPELGDLVGKQRPKKRAHADAGEKIALPTDLRPA